MKNKTLLTLLLVCTAVSSSFADPYRPEKRWRGFNLMGMFIKGASMSPGSFPEKDFKEIHELGFNFVRLPLDYRFWIKDGDWEKIDEAALAPLDEAVRLGQKYNIHVMINLHRAPGYTVARPHEKLNVFKDAEALRVCVKHWSMLAERYREIPAKDLCFNLFNEPVATPEEYERVAGVLVKAIRAYNPDRLIVCDGLSYGTKIVPELFKYNVGQATRGYAPSFISHYRASWAGNSTRTPAWPPSGAVSPLYGPMKKEHSKPLVIEGLPACRMTIDPARVSGNVTFEVKADDKVVGTFPLEPKKGDGWSNVDFKKEWNIYQADCDKMLNVDIPSGIKRVSVNIVKGDWAGINKIVCSSSAAGKKVELSFSPQWYVANPVIKFRGFNQHTPFQEENACNGVQWLEKNVMGPWVEASRSGQFVMVGEFGSYKYTPHKIVLDWMEDYLKIWKKADIGWALWNFSGSLGILDSGREDVEYEDFHGRKLDRKMLELLQRY